jgi:methionine-rich copper-binding protein CopC
MRRPAVVTLTLALVVVPLLAVASPAVAASPTSTVTTSDTALRAGETATMTITFSEPVDGFDNADVQVSGGTISAFAGDAVTQTAVFTPAPGFEGTATVRVDNAGVTGSGTVPGTGTSEVTMAVDTLGPTVTSFVVADALLLAGETTRVTITFSERVDAFTTADLVVPNGELRALGTSDRITWTAELVPAAGVRVAGNVITLRAGALVDGSGNGGAGASSTSYAVDTVRPGATVVVREDVLGIGASSLVIITFSDAVAGFRNDDLTVPNGLLSQVSSSDGGITWTADLRPQDGVAVAGNVISLDLAGVANVSGNAGTGTVESTPYAVDTVRPTATIDVAPPVVGIGGTAAVTVTFSEPVTGLTPAAVTSTGGTLTGLGTTNGITWTGTYVPAAATETTTASVRVDTAAVADGAGNAGSGVVTSVPLTVDTVAPTATLRLAAARVTGPITLTVTFSEPVTTLTLADLRATRGSLSALATADAGRTWTATFTPDAGVSAQALTIRLDLPGVTDLAGNPGSSAVLSAAFGVETAPVVPVAPAVPVQPAPAAPVPAARVPAPAAAPAAAGARPTLARTGADTWVLTGVATGLLAVGLAAVRLRTRRRPAAG